MKILQSFKIPLLLLGLCLLAFVPQITRSGYYLDDWIILASYVLGGAQGLYGYTLTDSRPMIFGIWWLGFQVVGTNPVAWQVWALFWRWLTTVLIWAGWKSIWPQAEKQVSLTVLLFAVYPLFKQQGSALSYSAHWFSFALYALSIYLMVLAVRKPRCSVALTAGALAVTTVQLVTLEYMVGLELLRPFLLWLILNNQSRQSVFQLAKAVLFRWMPYALLLGAYGIWRFQFMPGPDTDRNAPMLITGLLHAPLTTLPTLAVMVAQDFVESLLGAWYRTYQADLLAVRSIRDLFNWAMVLFTTGALFLMFRRGRQDETTGENGKSVPWHWQAIGLGLIAMLLGFLPGWAIERHFADFLGAYNDRFGLAAMAGASLVLVGVIDGMIKSPYKVLIACLLIGLGLGFQLRSGYTYVQSWNKQTRLFWQMKWRIPDLEPQTAILGNGPMMSYMGSWTHAMAFNLMYPPDIYSDQQAHWYIDLNKQSVTGDGDGDAMVLAVKNAMRYQGAAKNNLVIQYEPDENQCLWVLDSKDQHNSYIQDIQREALSSSNLTRIHTTSQRELRSDIFGKEIPHTWCYYFEKADLARQEQNWNEVMSLWKQADEKGYQPGSQSSVEYSPFIESAAHTGDYPLALALSKKTAFPFYEMRAYVCDTWSRIDQEEHLAETQPDVLKSVIEDFQCQDNFPN